MSRSITNIQKKELAKVLYTKENLTQAEIAERVGCSRVTVGKWCKEGNWEMLRASITMTKEEQLKSLYRQMIELNKVIEDRAEGERFPTTAEADIIAKITSATDKLEAEVGLRFIISSFRDLMTWLRKIDLEKAKEIAPLLDSFIQHKAKQ